MANRIGYRRHRSSIAPCVHIDAPIEAVWAEIADHEALEPGGTVAINAIHLDHIPEFEYSKLWLERGLRSVGAGFSSSRSSDSRHGPE